MIGSLTGATSARAEAIGILAALTLVANLIMVGAFLIRRRRRGPLAVQAPVDRTAGLAPGGGPVRRVIALITALILLAVYVLAVVPAVAAVPVLFGLDTSVALTPGGVLYRGAAYTLDVALGFVALRYAYYYWCWFTSRRHFHRPDPIDVKELAARDIPFMKVQVTTKGGALSVVERSLRELERIVTTHRFLARRMSVEVITEDASEVVALNARFTGSVLSVHALQLPEDYRTPKGTLLKARALQYMVELRRAGYGRRRGRTFIIHFDEETFVEESNLLLLVSYLAGDPRPVSQGPILYPLEWADTPLLCRALESMRPFGCSECARVMENPPPPHLHGSNLVVDESVENEIGWDFGTLGGQPYVAEDLLFGLRAYAVLGPEGFGWHGATMLEQPPLTLYWAVQQRMRWVLGALQGMFAMRHDADYAGISTYHRRRLTLAIGSRIATYCLGYPLGFAGLYFLLRPKHFEVRWDSPFGYWRILIIAAGVGWLLSYQIGLARNLRYQQLPWTTRVAQHIGMLLVTPLAGLCETVGPYVAVLRWLVGIRQARWTPTPKLAEGRGRPAPEPASEAREPQRVG